MRVASIFMYNPTSGWNPRDRHEYDKSYSCTDAFTNEFLTNEKMKLIKKEVECLGSVFVVHLIMKTEYSINHPDSNQAHYQLIATLYTNY